MTTETQDRTTILAWLFTVLTIRCDVSNCIVVESCMKGRIDMFGDAIRRPGTSEINCTMVKARNPSQASGMMISSTFTQDYIFTHCSKVTDCQKHHSKDYLVFNDKKVLAFTLDSRNPKATLEPVSWHISNTCNYWSVAYDQGRVYWMCDDGHRIGVGALHLHNNTIESTKYIDIKETNPRVLKGKERFRWFSLDGEHGVFLALERKAHRVHRCEMTSPYDVINCHDIRKMKGSTFVMPDKRNRRIYYLNSCLGSMTYEENDHVTYCAIGRLMSYFSISHTDNQIRVFTCTKRAIYHYILEKNRAVKTKKISLHRSQCARTWQIGQTTLISDGKSSLVHVDDEEETIWAPVVSTGVFFLHKIE